MVTIGEVASAKSIFSPIYNWWQRKFGKPKLNLEIGKGMPFEVTEPSDAKEHAARGFRVQVTNFGSSDYECLAKIVEMKRTDGTPFGNIFLPVGLKTQHQKLQQRSSGPFNLRVGESKLIEVAYLDEQDPNSEIVLQYESDSYLNCVPRASYSITLVVYGGGKPVEGKYRIYVDARGFLKLANET